MYPLWRIERYLRTGLFNGIKVFDTSVQFSRPVVSNSFLSHGLQHARLPWPSPSPRVCSNLCPFSQWCCLTISSSAALFSFLPSIFPSIRVFSSKLSFHIRWPKSWSFSFSIQPSNEYSGLISFRIDWFNLLAVQGTLWVIFFTILYPMYPSTKHLHLL